jgi:hypothetical protein
MVLVCEPSEISLSGKNQPTVHVLLVEVYGHVPPIWKRWVLHHGEQVLCPWLQAVPDGLDVRLTQGGLNRDEARAVPAMAL